MKFSLLNTSLKLNKSFSKLQDWSYCQLSDHSAHLIIAFIKLKLFCFLLCDITLHTIKSCSFFPKSRTICVYDKTFLWYCRPPKCCKSYHSNQFNLTVCTGMYYDETREGTCTCISTIFFTFLRTENLFQILKFKKIVMFKDDLFGTFILKWY